MITDVVMVERFEARNVLDLHSVYAENAASIVPFAELRGHFVPRDSLPTHPAWAPVRAADGSIPETVLLLGVSGAMLGAQAHLSVALRQKLADTRKAPADPKNLTPRVRRAIPAFVEGSHLRIEADEVRGGRRQVLEQALQLFALAEQIVGEDGDIFLVDRLVGQATPLARARLMQAAGRAFYLQEQYLQSVERARADLARATVETAAILLAGLAPDGTLRLELHEGQTVVWGESNEDVFPAVARKRRNAAVVVQTHRSGNRALVVAKSDIGLRPAGYESFGTLALVAAALRMLDHRARTGALPTADPELCMTGAGASGIFVLNSGANAFGNLSLSQPVSRLGNTALHAAVRSALIVPRSMVDAVRQVAALPSHETVRVLELVAKKLEGTA